MSGKQDRAPAFGTALSSADADQAASRLAPDGLQSTGAGSDWNLDDPFSDLAAHLDKCADEIEENEEGCGIAYGGAILRSIHVRTAAAVVRMACKLAGETA